MLDSKRIDQLRIYAYGHHDDDLLNELLDLIVQLQTIIISSCGNCTISDFAKREWCSQCGFKRSKDVYEN